jgi:hypothetical protein
LLLGALSLTAHKHKTVRKTGSGAHISPAAPLLAVWQPLKIVFRRSRGNPVFASRVHNRSRRLSRMPTRAMNGDITPLTGNRCGKTLQMVLMLENVDCRAK